MLVLAKYDILQKCPHFHNLLYQALRVHVTQVGGYLPGTPVKGVFVAEDRKIGN